MILTEAGRGWQRLGLWTLSLSQESHHRSGGWHRPGQDVICCHTKPREMVAWWSGAAGIEQQQPRVQNYRGKLQLQSCSRTDERSSTMENSYSGVHRAPIKLAVSCRLSELSLFFGHWNRGFLVVPSRGSRENSRSYGKLSLKLAHDKGRAWGQGTETASYCHGGTVEGLLPAVCEFLSTQMSSRGQPG